MVPLRCGLSLSLAGLKLMDAVVIAMVATSGLVMNELITMVVDNLVGLLLEQEA